MRNAKNKFVAVLLVVFSFVSIFSLSSCKEKIKYDEDEVLTAARALLKEAEFLNKIYYGSGIEYYESDRSNGYYKEAKNSHLQELGFSTIEELKALTEKTFSYEYSSLLYSTILSSLKDDSTIVSTARYYQAYDEKTKESYIMVHSKFEIMFKDSISYDYGSLKVDRANKEKIYVTVNATVTTSEGKSQNTTLTITLVKENDGWKIDNPTYANYNSLKDRYDELKDKDIK